MTDDADTLLALDADLRAAFDDALKAEPLPPDTAARIKRRLLDRIAAAEPAQVAIAPDGGRWKPFMPGVEIKVLHRSGDVMSYLLRMGPGTALPNHRHPHDEECVVLEGTLRIGDLVLGPGGFHSVRRDVLDADSTTEEGCVIYLRGASPKAEHLV